MDKLQKLTLEVTPRQVQAFLQYVDAGYPSFIPTNAAREVNNFVASVRYAAATTPTKTLRAVIATDNVSTEEHVRLWNHLCGCDDCVTFQQAQERGDHD